MVCALAIPRVFDDTGVVFGLGFLLVVVVHTALYTRSHGYDSIWYGAPNALAALSVTAAGLVDGLAADGLWVLALVPQLGLSRWRGRDTSAGCAPCARA